MISTDKTKIKELLSRGVDEIIDKKKLEKKLLSGKQLRIKLGIDPTSPNLHVGRSIPILKLLDFQELGHKIVFIIGDFTGLVGDTSDKDSERPMLDRKVIEKNMKEYKAQAGKILDLAKCEVRYNTEWLAGLNYHDIGNHADIFSLHDFLMRENIKKRLDAGKRISLREILYPLMQGFDSVAVKADVELGGTDQRFNLLAGRKLQEHFGQAPQDIIMGPLIEGTDGRKMSSSWGNTINLTDKPNEIFGKAMSIPDKLIIKYFTLATRVSIKEVNKLEKVTKSGNPRDAKVKLASELVRMYHGPKKAKEAEFHFVNTFSKKKMPDNISELKPKAYDIVSVLISAKFVTSKSEARRAIDQGGVKINNKKIDSIDVLLKKGDVLQKGKRFFVRVK
jgi:tyrosyl-tRNA synthetase